MLTYKDSLRQRLYSDSFEEGLRFGIKYFAKIKANEVAGLFADGGKLAGKKIKFGTGKGSVELAYHELRARGYSDEQIANFIKQDKNGALSFASGPKTRKQMDVVEGYGTKGGTHEINGKTYLDAAGYHGDYNAYAADAQKLNLNAMEKSKFGRVIKDQHAAENAYTDQFLGGSGSGRGGSGSGSGKEEGGVWNWIKENPGKTAAIGGGALVTGLGARALLKGRDDRDDRYYR
jgi:hypothetical protein